jgi:hypothetical protein
LPGFEPDPATLAVIEELAGIGRHGLDGLMAAFRANEGGGKLHHAKVLSVGAVVAWTNPGGFVA